MTVCFVGYSRSLPYGAQSAASTVAAYSGYTDPASYYQGIAGTGQAAQPWTNTAALNWQTNNQSQVGMSSVLPQQDYSNSATNQQQLQGNAALNQEGIGILNNNTGTDLSQSDQANAVTNTAAGFPTVQSILSKAGAVPGAFQANPLLIQALIQQQQQKAMLANLPAGLMANHPLVKALQAAQATQAVQLAQAAQFVQAQVAQARQVEAKKVGLLGNSPFGGTSSGSQPATSNTAPVPSIPGAMGLLKPPGGLTPVQQAALLNMGRGAMINQAMMAKKPVLGMIPSLFQNAGTFGNPAAAKMAAAAAVAAATQKSMANSGVPNCVVMVYGLTMKIFNCDRLFNLFCLYGNVMKIKFLLNKDGVAMVQMADKMAADMIIKHYTGQKVFDNKLHLIYSKHPYIGDISASGCLGDGSPTAFNYTDSPKNRFKFAGDSGNLKNRFQAPCKMLHFFNAPPTCSVEDLQKLLRDAGAPVPSRGTFFAGRTTGRSSSGLLEMGSVSNAIEAVALCNHSLLATEGGTYTIKLAFSPSSSLPPTALTAVPSMSDVEKRAYGGAESPPIDESSVSNSSLLGSPQTTGNPSSILGDSLNLSSSTSLLGSPPNTGISSTGASGSILGAPPTAANLSAFHVESNRGTGLLGDPPVMGETAGILLGDIGRKSLLGERPVGNPLSTPRAGNESSVGILGEPPKASDVGVPHSLATQETMGTLANIPSLTQPSLSGYTSGVVHGQPLIPGLPQHTGGHTTGQ